MVAPIAEDSHRPIRLPTAAAVPPEVPKAIASALKNRPKSRFTFFAFIASTVLSGTWMGAVGAFLLGYFHSAAIGSLDIQQIAIFVVATFVPPLLFMTVAWVLIRGQAMGEAAQSFAEATEQLFAADEIATNTAIRIGQAVRHELDALNAGLDTAFGRMRALEALLQTQVEELDKVGTRLDTHGDDVAERLSQERAEIQKAAAVIGETAMKSGETMADRASLLKATIEAAENALKNAGGQLETQTANFRQAASEAAEAPHAVAIELDKQVKRIETVSDAAVARAEFVLTRQERHREAMGEMLQRLKDEGLVFETALTAERESLERLLASVDVEAKKFDSLTAEAQRRLDAVMASSASRTAQMAQTYAREAVNLKETGDAANKALATVAEELQQAGATAQTLIAETTTRAKADANAMVGTTMSEVGKLLQTADELTEGTRQLQDALSAAAEEMQRHMMELPDLAKTEAAKVRETVRQETEEMLSISAQTLATLRAREKAILQQYQAPERVPTRDEETAGLNFLRRKLGGGKPKHPAPEEDLRNRQKNWQLSSVLAAAETPKHSPQGQPAATKPAGAKLTAAASLQVLQETLAEMAVDLDAVGPRPQEWRRYLEGDRAIFSRKLANAIDGETVHRIAMLYRENVGFRTAANTYAEEFETLLRQVHGGEGGSLLATTLLSADTGSIYLAISYALGRL